MFLKMPESYSISFPVTVPIDGMTVRIRPISPDDRERILNGLKEISAETSYHRFFTPFFYPNEEQLRYLTEVDGEHHVALGAVDAATEGEPGLGAARYVRLADEPEVAEAAVIVVDRYQKRGIGTLLLAALSRYAHGKGVRVFRAYVMQDNRRFLEYLRGLGPLREEARDGVVEVDLPVYGHPDQLPDDPRIDRARRAWQLLVDGKESEEE